MNTSSTTRPRVFFDIKIGGKIIKAKIFYRRRNWKNYF